MSKSSAQKKIGEKQLYPLAFHPSLNATSWVSLKNEHDGSVDYLVIQKPKSKRSFHEVVTYFTLHALPWNTFAIISIYLNYLLISYVYFFIRSSDPFIWPFYIIAVFDAFYLIDVLLAGAFYFNKRIRPTAVKKRRNICVVFLDLLVSLPYSGVFLVMEQNTKSLIFMFLRCITFVRICRLLVYFNNRENYVTSWRWFIFCVKFFCYFSVLQHTITYSMYLLAFPIGYDKPGNWTKTLNNASYPTNTMEWYFIGTYVTISGLTNCGFGDVLSTNIKEKLASIVVMCFGIIIWTFYTSSLTLLFLKSRYQTYKIQKQVQLIMLHLKHMEDVEIVNKIMKYYETLWFKKSAVVNPDMGYIPGEINMQMNQHVNSSLLRCSEVFKYKTETYLRNLSQYIKPEFFLIGSNIYTENEFKYKMIIIKSGTIDILSEADSETPMLSFGSGTCLGETSLIMCMPAKVTVKASTYVEAHVLYMKDFYMVSTNYPDVFFEIRSTIFKRIYRTVISDRENNNLLKDLKNIIRGKPQVQVASNMYTHLLSLYKYEEAEKRKIWSFPWILKRESLLMLLWEIFIAANAITVAIFYPYFIAFEHRFPHWFEKIADGIHVIFVIDVYVLLTTTIDKNGYVLNTLKKILDERMDTFGFYLDVFAAFYIEVYAYLAEDVDRFYYLLKLNRLLKMYRITTLCDRLQNTLVLNTMVVPFAKYVIFVLLFGYCFGILLYLETCYFYSCKYDGWFITMINSDVQFRTIAIDTLGKCLMSVYFGFSTFLSTGIGDVLPTNFHDVVYVMIGLLIGKLIAGYYLAEMVALLTFKQKNVKKFQEKLRVIHFYVKNRYVPKKLEKRITKYFQTQWEYNEARYVLDKRPLLHNAPDYLRREILRRERFETLRKVEIFSEFDDGFVDFLVLHSRMVVLPPNETVTYLGSINREMYIIYKGYCLQQTEKNMYKTIGPGKAIGFPSLLFGLPSLSNIYTLTHCLLIYIDVKIFNRGLLNVHDLYKLVYKTRQQILAKFHGNFEVKMIENPHYAKKKKLKMKYKKMNKKVIAKKSFLNTYKFCIYHGESYSKLSNRTSRICFLKYLLMPLIILPSGPFLKCWASMRIIVTIFVAFGLPFQYIFAPYRSEVHYVIFVIDVFVYVDMYLMFHVGYYGKHKQLIVHPWMTAEHYLKGPFIFDLVIWFPYSGLIQLLDSGHNEGHSNFAHSFSLHLFHCSAHLIKILDVYRLPCAFRYLESKFQRGKVFYFFKYVLYMLLLIHGWSMFIMASTCKYLHKTDLNHTRYNNTKITGFIPMPLKEFNLYCRENTWLARSRFRNYCTLEVYAAAVYWTTTNMAYVGFGDIVAQNKKEVLISLLIMVTGLLYFGYILVKITSQDVIFRNTLLNSEAKYLCMLHYLTQEKVSTLLRAKFKQYVQYKWSRNRNYNLHGILSEMNGTLHEDVMLHLYEETLRHVPMFENMDYSFFRVFGKELREQYYLEGQTVLNVNDVVEDIFIIHKGTVEVSSHYQAIPVVMGVGGVFGNVFKQDMSLSGITVRAIKNLDVLCLNVITFRNMLKDYPFIQKKIGMFIKNDGHRHFAIPTSFVEESSSFINSNMYWATRQSITVHTKKTFIGTCRNSFTWNLHIFNIFSCLTMLAAYSNCLLTMYQFSYQHFCSYLLIMAIIIDVIFLLKFCLEINAPYITPQSHRYATSSWYDRCLRCKWNRTLDFVANLPFSYSLLFVPFISDDNANFYFSVWRLVTILRLYYILQFFSKYKNQLITKRFCLDLCILFISSTLTCHVFTCLWYMLICPFKKCNELSWFSTVDKNSPLEMYTTILYFIINIFTNTGTGDILPETTLQIVVVTCFIIISRVLLGYFIGQFITMLCCNSTSLSKYEAMMKELKIYFVNMGLKRNHLPHLWTYLCHLWKKKRGLQLPDLLIELPRTLRIELMNEIYGKLLKNSYIFCHTEFDFMRQLTIFLKPKTYFPGNYIVRDGDADSCMYFIHYGDVEILTLNKTYNETVHEVLHKSEVFGIVQGLFKEIPHHFSFRALTIVDVVVLKLDEWEHLLNYFPKSKNIIYQRVEEIYHTI